MNRRPFLATACALLLVCEAFVAAQANQPPADPITGTWTGDASQPGSTNRVALTLRLKLEGTAISGTLTTPQNSFEIVAGSFEPKSRAVKLEVDTSSNGIASRAVFEGQLTEAVIVGRYMRGEQTGDFKVSRAPQ
jgi:hypothetical protein